MHCLDRLIRTEVLGPLNVFSASTAEFQVTTQFINIDVDAVLAAAKNVDEGARGRFSAARCCGSSRPSAPAASGCKSSGADIKVGVSIVVTCPLP